MTDTKLLERIVVLPRVMAGKPVIRGTRLTVEFVLNRLGHAASAADLLREYPGLAAEDLHACMLFASLSLASTTFMPLAPQVCS